MISRILAALLALFVGAVGAQAQSTVELPLCSDFDLDSTSYTYCVTTGIEGNPFGTPFSTPGARVTTSGSSTTVTAATATSAPFAQATAGDELMFTYNGTTVRRYVVTASSVDSVVVNAAVNFATPGATVKRLKRTCGTSATSGWFPVRNTIGGSVTYSIDQLDVTGGIDVKFECRNQSSVATANTVTAVVNKTAVTAVVIQWDETFPWHECRLGFKIGSADDGVDTTTHLEQITAFVTERR